MKKKAQKLNKKISEQRILHKFENIGSAGVSGEKRLQEVLWHVKKETKMSGISAVLIALKKLSPGVRLVKQLKSGRTINKVSLVSPSRTYYDAIRWVEDGARGHDIRSPMAKKIAKDLRDVVRARDLRGGTGYAFKYKKEFYYTFRESRGISGAFRSKKDIEDNIKEEEFPEYNMRELLRRRPGNQNDAGGSRPGNENDAGGSRPGNENDSGGRPRGPRVKTQEGMRIRARLSAFLVNFNVPREAFASLAARRRKHREELREAFARLAARLRTHLRAALFCLPAARLRKHREELRLEALARLRGESLLILIEILSRYSQAPDRHSRRIISGLYKIIKEIRDSDSRKVLLSRREAFSRINRILSRYSQAPDRHSLRRISGLYTIINEIRDSDSRKFLLSRSRREDFSRINRIEKEKKNNE